MASSLSPSLFSTIPGVCGLYDILKDPTSGSYQSYALVACVMWQGV